jgi:hypothetical protein
MCVHESVQREGAEHLTGPRRGGPERANRFTHEAQKEEMNTVAEEGAWQLQQQVAVVLVKLGTCIAQTLLMCTVPHQGLSPGWDPTAGRNFWNRGNSLQNKLRNSKDKVQEQLGQGTLPGHFWSQAAKISKTLPRNTQQREFCRVRRLL